MAIDLADYERKAREAIQAFWGNRETAASVIAGKNMDGFIELTMDIVHANGLDEAEIHRKRRVVTLPGYFRPTKQWDLVVIHREQLVAALEFKSQVGSYGNNFNNRVEEAIGSAHDLWVAYREGAFGEQPRPFVGWLMLFEDAEGSRASVRDVSAHFPVFPEFQGASYADRYNILCRKLVQERLYTAASILLSPKQAIDTGEYSELSDLTGLGTFVTELAGHVAAAAARQ